MCQVKEIGFYYNCEDCEDCFPLCTIILFKNNKIITAGEYLDSNTFPSVLSKLSWNLENFPDNKLDQNELNFTISCKVDENDIGQAISSTSHIIVLEPNKKYDFLPDYI